MMMTDSAWNLLTPSHRLTIVSRAGRGVAGVLDWPDVDVSKGGDYCPARGELGTGIAL